MKTTRESREFIARNCLRHEYDVRQVCDDANLGEEAIEWLRKHGFACLDASVALRAVVRGCNDRRQPCQGCVNKRDLERRIEALERHEVLNR